MPGIIEDGDPGESGLQVDATASVARSEHEVPALDVESFIDRLRFMGLDRDLVDEADRRLRADALIGMRWVKARLEDLEPPRKPPTCDCGETLVDVSWRGRATIRCSVCGSRWGVEVVDENSESLWAIRGPTADWRAANPIEEEDLYGDFQPEDILRHGLPPVPESGIEPGTYFPVASWQADRHAAVLYVHRLAPGEAEVAGDEYEDETEHLVRDDEGEWTSTGSGGGNWVNVFDPPADLLEKYVVLGTGISGFSRADETVYTTGGVCSSAVAAVETIDSYGTRSFAIHRERPYFVVGVLGSGRVRILDDNGDVVCTQNGRRLDFPPNG